MVEIGFDALKNDSFLHVVKTKQVASTVFVSLFKYTSRGQ